jgi:AraC family transcriptional regulator of adaptative response/methylated-DNA-[protein]-cysteine methyltransferase
VLQAAIDAGLSGPGRLHDLFVTLEAVTPGEFKARGRGITFRHGIAESPFGPALIVASERGIAFLAFADEAGGFAGLDDFRAAWREADWQLDEAGARRIAAEIWNARAARQRRLTLWVHGSNFQLQVWRALLAAGQRSTVSYQQLAHAIGRDSACRAVGSAVGANPVAWLIPCHRVLRANGALGGYRWGIERKQAMLGWELARTVRNASRRRPSASRASAGSR